MKSKRMLFAVCLVLGLAGIAQAWTFRPATLKATPVIGGTYDPAGKPPGVVYPSFLSSPGESLDFTWYDNQHSCSVGRMIVQDRIGVGGLHIAYMKSPDNTHFPRNAAYQFNDKIGGGWSGELDANTGRAGYVNIDVLSDGRAVMVFHQSGGAGNRAVVAVDAARGAGAFTVTSIDTNSYPPGSSAPLWPKVAVGPLGSIHVTACMQTNAHLLYSRFAFGDTTRRWVVLDSLVNALSNVLFTSRSSGKVAVAYTKPRPSSPNGQINMDVWYRESVNHGLTWGPKINVTNYLNSDTVRAYCDVSGVYDNNDNLHLVWSGMRVIGDSAYFNASAIFHWSQATGIDLVSGPGHNFPGTFWWSLPGHPSSGKLDVNRPSLSVDASGKLYCVWAGQVLTDDTSAGGYINMDLYGRGSLDNGNTWGAFGRTDTMIYLTNSHTPGGLPGFCDDDEYPSITKFTTDSVRTLFLEDKDAGSSVANEGGPTANPIKYLAVRADWFWPPSGVETPVGRLDGLAGGQLKAQPNPFVSFAAIPGHETENFELYDISGRRIGTYRGDRIGHDLGPGVYFVRAKGGTGITARVVKVR